MKAKAFLIAVILGFTSIVTSCDDDDDMVVAPTSPDQILNKPPQNGINPDLGSDKAEDTGNANGTGLDGDGNVN